MAILIHSSTTTHRLQKAVRLLQIISYHLTLGPQLQQLYRLARVVQCDHLVHRSKKWPWWISWSSNSVSSTSVRKPLSLVSKRLEWLAAWALSSSLWRIWISIARLILKVTRLIHSRLIRAQASIICSCRRSGPTWTRPTPRVVKSGPQSSYKSARTS